MSKSSLMQWLDELLNPLNARMQRDMAEMREDLAKRKEMLIPLHLQEELELLSSQYLPLGGKPKKKRAPESGLFTTIYQEPAIAWSFRLYPDKSRQALLVALTAHQEYLYKFREQEIEIVIGPYRVGSLTASRQLISSRKRELLAQYGKGNSSYMPIQVYGREVASLVLPSETPVPMPRTFAYLMEMNENERELLMSLTILEMVRWRVGR